MKKVHGENALIFYQILSTNSLSQEIDCLPTVDSSLENSYVDMGSN